MFLPVISTAPGAFDVKRSDGGHAVTVPLTATECGMQMAALEVRLDPAFFMGVPLHAYEFSILTFNEDTGKSQTIYDRTAASGYIDCVRPLIMPCVVGATEALIKAVQPTAIYRVTFVSHPNAKALSKHHMVTDTIANMGYGIASIGTDGYSRQFWVMIKEEANDA